MRFPYYNRLSRKLQAVYRQSDGIETIALAKPATLAPLAAKVEDALKSEETRQVNAAANELITAICEGLEIPHARVRVLAKRPADDWGELHGLYEPANGRKLGEITVWMRTAKRKQVVAFRTFLRTLLHELCHHLDYELLELADSLHTQGFYKRESSLFKQLVPETKKPERTAQK